MPSVSQNGKRRLHKSLEDFFLFSSPYLLTHFSLPSPDFLPGSRFSCNSRPFDLFRYHNLVLALYNILVSEVERRFSDVLSCVLCKVLKERDILSNLLRQSSSRLVRSKILPLCSFIMLNKTMLNLLDINVSAMPLWTRELLRISPMERWPWIKLGSRETYLWKQKRKKTEKGLRFSVGPTTPLMHCTSPDQLCAVWIIGETRKRCRVEIIGGLNTVDKSKDCVIRNFYQSQVLYSHCIISFACSCR